MARIHVTGFVHGFSSRNSCIVPAGLSVQVVNPGTSVPVSFSTWNAATGGASQGGTLTLSGNKYEFWMDNPASFDLLVTATGHNTLRIRQDYGAHNGLDNTVTGVGGAVRNKTINLTSTTSTAPPEYGTDD